MFTAFAAAEETVPADVGELVEMYVVLEVGAWVGSIVLGASDRVEVGDAVGEVMLGKVALNAVVLDDVMLE